MKISVDVTPGAVEVYKAYVLKQSANMAVVGFNCKARHVYFTGELAYPMAGVDVVKFDAEPARIKFLNLPADWRIFGSWTDRCSFYVLVGEDYTHDSLEGSIIWESPE